MTTSSPRKRLFYTYDNESYADKDENIHCQKASQCSFDTDILEFVLETFMCLFPTKDCCHDGNNLKNLGCICVPCGDDTHCASCRYGMSNDWDSIQVRPSSQGSVDETKGGELDDSDVRIGQPNSAELFQQARSY